MIYENDIIKWISVEDRMPNIDGKVIACYHFKNSKMCFVGVLDYYFCDPNPHFQYAGTELVVTHWMPLPEPPKEAMQE